MLGIFVIDKNTILMVSLVVDSIIDVLFGVYTLKLWSQAGAYPEIWIRGA